MDKPVSISVILITFRRPGLLRACLESLAAARTPEVIEVIVALNGRGDTETAVYLREAAGRYDFLKVLEIPRTCRGEARNAALKTARGSWLCFLDDDTEVPPAYFANFVRETGLGAADVLGGGQTMRAEASTVFEKAVYFTLASLWGAGPYRVRFRPFEGRRAAGPEEFILCNLSIKREALEKNSLAFEGHLTSAEENLLLNKLAGLGAVMRMSGELNLFHRRRPDCASFARQTFMSGIGRAQMTFLYPRGFTLFTALPGLGLASFAAGCFFAPELLGAAVCAYLAVCAVFALRAAGDYGPGAAGVSFFLFPVIHFSYAAGWWCGLLEPARDLLCGVKGRRSRCVCGKEII